MSGLVCNKDVAMTGGWRKGRIPVSKPSPGRKASLPDVATLRGPHLGAGEGALPPSIPLKNPKAKAMKRDRIIRFRVSAEEKSLIEEKASADSQTVTDFLRQRALHYRLRTSPNEKERIRQVARIGNNLNQIARWANTYKEKAETMTILAALVSLERAVKNPEAESTEEGGDKPCI
jgi:hypothetical protein